MTDATIEQEPVNPEEVPCSNVRFQFTMDIGDIDNLGEGLNTLANALGRLGIDGVRMVATDKDTNETYLLFDGEATPLGDDLSQTLAAMELKDEQDEDGDDSNQG